MGMVFLSQLQAVGYGFLGYLVPFLFVLSLVVFFHELGHFLIARWCGVRILVFSIGFGPEIVGFNDRHGTRWKISGVPLGGYVKFFGDDSAASTPDTAQIAAMNEVEKSQSFVGQSVAKRAAIVVAGPMANFLLAIVIFAGVFMLYGQQTMSARVDVVVPDSAAAAAGFQPGDVVTAIDGKPIVDFNEMKRIVSLNAGKTLDFAIERNGVAQNLKAAPSGSQRPGLLGATCVTGLLGVEHSPTADDLQLHTLSPPRALFMGARETWDVVDQTLSYLGCVIAGRASANQVGGPIRIAEMSHQVATLGFTPLIQWAGLISVSIGLLNLFPIPLLDGGHLLFYAVEAIRGRPMSERAQEVGFRIGLAIVLMLMIFATFNDIVHLATS